MLMQVRAALTGDHRVHDFRGTPFEIGRQHGQALRRRIHDELRRASEQFAQQWGMSVERVVDRVYAEFERLFRDRVPLAVEEIKGLADGADLSDPQAFLVSTFDGLKSLRAASACTAVACGRAATAGAKVLMGQTKDTQAGIDRFQIMRFAYSSGRRMVLLNYPGWIGNIGLTSDGMCLAGNSLYAKGPPAGDAVPYSLLKRLVLESGSTRQVLDGIDGLTFENGCFLIGDSSDHIVCIESVAGRHYVRDVSGQAFGHANSILTDEAKQYENETLGSASSPTRQRNIQQRLDAKRGSITAGDIEAMFADHADFPTSVCLHASSTDPHRTTAAFVANLTDRQIDIAIGNPCAAEFRKYELPA